MFDKGRQTRKRYLKAMFSEQKSYLSLLGNLCVSYAWLRIDVSMIGKRRITRGNFEMFPWECKQDNQTWFPVFMAARRDLGPIMQIQAV